MSLLRRLKTGLVLTKDSLLLIRHNPRLTLFPIIGGLAGIAFLGIFLGITFGVLAIAPDGVALLGLAVIYLGLTFISTLFTAGLVHQTRAVIDGDEPSIRDGLESAWEVKRALLIWAAISATVGLLINAIENSNSRMSQIFGVAWTLLTFFIVPVIVFEQPAVKEMFTDSAGTFKQTWGETPISLIAIQIVGLLVIVPFGAVGIYLLSAGFVISGVVSLLVGFILALTIAQTLQGVLKTTLYLYATDGTCPDEFDDVDFDELTTDVAEARSSPAGLSTGGFK